MSQTANNRVPRGWWTKERIFKESHNYSSKSEFRKAASAAYKTALKYGWLNEMTWLPERKIKWTRDAVFEESKKYSTRNEFQKACQSAYNVANRNLWIDEMPWLKKPDHLIDWTKEMVIEESRKYHSRSEFRKKSRHVFGVACDNGWDKEMPWLNVERKKRNPWTREKTFEEAKKYTRRSDFKQNSGYAYRTAKAEGWLDDYTWFDPVRKRHSWDRESVFAESKKYKSRWEFGTNSSAYQVALRNGWIEEMTWLLPAVRKPVRWTKEAVLEESKKYTTRWEFGKNSPAYQVATKNGWINEMPWLLPYKVEPRKWTKEAVFNESRKYSTLKDFREASISAYVKASENGWFEEMPWLSRAKRPHYWDDKERVKEEATKYTCLADFNKKSTPAYLSAKRNGWLSEFNWLVPYVPQPKRWSKEVVDEEARKYTTRYAFSDGCPGAYNVACHKGWINDYTWLSRERRPNRNPKWNRETVFAEARKYDFRKDFQQQSNSAYNVARKEKWLDEMDWFKTYDFTQARRWTKEEVFRFSRQYHSRKEFQKGNSQAYKKAYLNHWLEEMPWIESKRREWDRETVFEESKKYTARGAFSLACTSAYSIALKNGWLEDMPWLGTPKVYDSHRYFVYAYEDNVNRVAYVGLTLNPKERHEAHATGIRRGVKSFSAVYNYFTRKALPVPDPLYLEEGLCATDARALEDYWLNEYRKKGYMVLNRGKTGEKSGSLGSSARKWTKSKVFEESKKYSSRSSFAVGCSPAYNIARKNGWLEDMDWLLPGKKLWTKEDVFSEAKKYRTASEFVKNASGAYDVAHRNGWLSEMTWFENGRLKWTREKVFELSRQYTTRKDFKAACLAAYRHAQENGWLDEMHWLEADRRKAWTKSEAIEESKKYSSRRQYQQGSPTAYHASARKGWLDEMNWLIPKRNIWNEETVREESKKYTSRVAFMKGSAGAYSIAVKNKWLDQYTWLVSARFGPRKWTKEKLRELAKQFHSKKEFRMSYSGAYSAAYESGWLDEIAEENGW